MSLVSKAFELRLEAIEQELSEIRQSMTVVSMALVRMTQMVEDAAEHVLPEAPEASD